MATQCTIEYFYMSIVIKVQVTEQQQQRNRNAVHVLNDFISNRLYLA